MSGRLMDDVTFALWLVASVVGVAVIILLLGF